MERRAATLLAVALLTVAGCSDGKKEAATSPRATPSAPACVDVANVPLPSDAAGLVATIGRQVKAARTFHVELVSVGEDGSRLTAGGDARTDAPAPAARLTITDEGTTYAVLLDGVAYVRDQNAEVEPGRPWARLARSDLKAVAPSGTPDPRTGAQAADLRRMLGTLLDGVDRAFRQITADTGLAIVGAGAVSGKPADDPIDGRTAHRFTGATATNAVRGDDEITALGRAGVAELPWKLWVDDRGLPLRFTVSLGRRGSLTTTYARWGAPVTIEAPPSNQVASLG
jgi:hypothetical protein